ncbi:hypothetical protein [Oenococcus oeni]|uniref:Uncharacterized protein n=6 Tax=Oenococcus oeni TaxID=1247 RepID=Q04H65_OENOB|nr:hypothetical protein [Oenococcus oeni]EAV39622.1 hypothetical protein OENOO_52047 [Oenococcus oeni ATCC BAA-1163]KGO16804.1 hypothetical protein OA32_02725 [Oenococcus oeni X2L]ABJ56207.1 hypothetical protein OEOE_0220 [Oenococcus oeni PSU-1]EJO04192.1 hypothetical protein AWRIB553_1711 [Oenococcus oeni AWRIB553]EJO07393.1 hypothetical protein AWRIB422_438 [Oenococcus oeni AWRIB422]
MIFGHILFGTISLIGVLLLDYGFRDEFNSLNLIQKLAIFFSIFGIFATVAFGLFMVGNLLAGAAVSIVGLVLLVYLIRPTVKEKNSNK